MTTNKIKCLMIILLALCGLLITILALRHRIRYIWTSDAERERGRVELDEEVPS